MIIGYQGVLLLGPSGSGKSDLALRLIDGGGRLIADDLVAVTAEKGDLVGRPAGDETRYGVLEVRGVGLLSVPTAPQAILALAVQLLPPGEAPARLPEPAVKSLLGIDLPEVSLNPFEASAAAKIRAAISFRRVA